MRAVVGVADVREGDQNTIASRRNLQAKIVILLKHGERIAGHKSASRHDQEATFYHGENVVLAVAHGYSTAIIERAPEANVGIGHLLSRW